MHDVHFLGGRVIDGSGAPEHRADVAIEGDRIVAVGDLTGQRARRVIRLDDQVLAPGFIDIHTHCDFTLPRYPRAEAMVRQGVTTVVGGNCSFSPFPVTPERLDLTRSYSAFLDAGIDWDWTTAREYAARLETLPLGCNIALQVGHGAVRIAVMGFENRAPSSSELERMQALIAQAMEEGAVGLSSGLIYSPSGYSDRAELAALAEVAGRFGGFYSSHIRGEGATLLDSVTEAITVGRQAHVPVQLSHHKAVDERNWGRTRESLALLDAARAEGLDVLADQYPYTAGSTTLSALLPGWAVEGGVESMQARLRDPATRSRIREDIFKSERFGAETVLVASVPEGPFKQYEGLRLAEIASQRRQDAVDAALDLITAEGARIGMITFSMSEDDVRRVMRHPSVAVASDGWTLSPDAGGKPHPRSYGTYVRVLGHYVREEGVLSLEEAVRKMTSLPATRLGRRDLGRVAPGCEADLVVFDPDTVAETASYEDPHQFGTGVEYVMVNGQIVIETREDTGAAAGKVLRRVKS
ncbi:MAG TPA: D-aminoacylase [Chloroflexota bacterium]|jgi:N-acyl-D-amino-acid deacylase|nr:D-aminoacylase [Chloroflexota bacterium]